MTPMTSKLANLLLASYLVINFLLQDSCVTMYFKTLSASCNQRKKAHIIECQPTYIQTWHAVHREFA